EDRAGAVSIREFVTLDELHAAVRLRVRTFYEYARDTVGAEVIHLFLLVCYVSSLSFQKNISINSRGGNLRSGFSLGNENVARFA
uniref:Uncharacterized protein n=1 Tax=Aegilops tauschii subsp. strangulata TaxID=200361 RepID=A0A452XXZ3_AEGTS